jgi:3-hydroxy acid dehydrogenase / malonic semialdehyde reductase
MSRLYQSLSLADQVVLITGATAGIGEACAWRFAELNTRLILVGRRTERLDSLAAALCKEYPQLTPPCLITLDIQELDQLKSLPEELPDGFKEVSILINNAGLAIGVNPVWANDMEAVQQMLTTNVAAVIGLTSAFLPGMRARGRGHLINIGSVAGHEAYPGGSVYCATKFAIDAFTSSARHDLVGTPLRVTVISPGMVNTEFSTVRLGSKDAADAVYQVCRVPCAPTLLCARFFEFE